MIVVVTGGRNYRRVAADIAFVETTLRNVGATTLRHGGASGADRVVALYVVEQTRAAKLDLGVEMWPACWREHGSSAGPKRNRAMLTGDGHYSDFMLTWPQTSGERAKLVIALPGGHGTADCMRAARGLGIEVWKAPSWPDYDANTTEEGPL